ncbi:MAG: hypothetical protein ACLTW9_11080 [Enterocloster sp.]
MQLSRVNPLDAVSMEEGKACPPGEIIPSFFLGKWVWRGNLPGSPVCQKKAFRASSLSLTLSFMVFSLFLNFWVLSGLSTKYTYFERYKDTWDLMAAVKEESGGMPPGLLGDIRSLFGSPGVSVMKKAEGYTWLEEGMLSKNSEGRRSGKP